MTSPSTPSIATIALVAFLSVTAALPGRAQVSAHFRVGETRLDARVDLELQDAEVAQVLASFGRILGHDAVIDPEIRGKVSVELHNVRAATALTAVCESVGCLWRIEDGRLHVVRDPEASRDRGTGSSSAGGPSAARLEMPIDMDLKDASLQETLRSFAVILEAGTEIEETLAGRVSVQLADTPVRKALDAICRVEGCRWELAETEGGPVLRVVRQ